MSQTAPVSNIAGALARATTQTGITLASLSNEKPLLLVFLRQFG